ncbi:MAG: type VI secretion system lipoprotein TssJ, partial [Pseudomonas sp.]|nr:type VI secretion system lipoprotein TssJ [Pseudomonas sp.]
MIFRFLLAAASVLLLTACAKDAAPPQAPEAQIDTTRVELHFHAIAGLNPGTTGQ